MYRSRNERRYYLENRPKRILCVGGSLNQTTIIHQVAGNLPEMDCRFTPFFGGGILTLLSQFKLLEHTILSGAHYQTTMQYLRDHHLPIDEGGKEGPYDLVLTCTDLVVPPSIRASKVILVQEGITENEGLIYSLVKNFKFPRVLANTAATGLSNAYEYFCVASQGYRSLFIRKGIQPEKVIVTGIPNFDKAIGYRKNNFPYKNFALIATSSIRETYGFDNRQEFLTKARRLAGKRRVIVKLHPNENMERAENEIRQIFPESLIYREGNLHEMIANCEILIAQRTSAIYTAAALGKKVYSSVPLKTIKELMPLQNGGTSARRIAEVCRKTLNTPPQNVLAPARYPGWSILSDLFAGN